MFIVASILFSGGLGAWSLLAFRTNQDKLYHAMGVASLIIFILLLFYLKMFLQKTKNSN